MAGYEFVEPLEHHLSEAEGLDSILREYAISAPTAHTALRTVKAQQSRMVDNCIRCGTRELFVQIPHDAAVETVNYWQKTGTDLGNLAESMRPHGTVLGFHNELRLQAPARRSLWTRNSVSRRHRLTVDLAS